MRMKIIELFNSCKLYNKSAFDSFKSVKTEEITRLDLLVESNLVAEGTVNISCWAVWDTLVIAMAFSVWWRYVFNQNQPYMDPRQTYSGNRI